MGFNAVLALATMVYPLAVFLGLQHWQPASLGLVLAGVVTLRLLFGRSSGADLQARWLLGCLLVFAATVYLVNDQRLLRFYPVLMNSLLLVMFVYTLIVPPSMAERLARLAEPDLDPRGVRYTRIVTGVWAGFFFLNACVATWTALGASLAMWSLYNGLIAYVLMALLFVVEYGVRQWVRARPPA